MNFIPKYGLYLCFQHTSNWCRYLVFDSVSEAENVFSKMKALPNHELGHWDIQKCERIVPFKMYYTGKSLSDIRTEYAPLINQSLSDRKCSEDAVKDKVLEQHWDLTDKQFTLSDNMICTIRPRISCSGDPVLSMNNIFGLVFKNDESERIINIKFSEDNFVHMLSKQRSIIYKHQDTGEVINNSPGRLFLPEYAHLGTGNDPIKTVYLNNEDMLLDDNLDVIFPKGGVFDLKRYYDKIK